MVSDIFNVIVTCTKNIRCYRDGNMRMFAFYGIACNPSLYSFSNCLEKLHLMAFNLTQEKVGKATSA